MSCPVIAHKVQNFCLCIFIKIGNCEEGLPYKQVLLAFRKVLTFQQYTMPTLKENLCVIYTNTLTESTFTLSVIYMYRTEPHIKADCGNTSFNRQTCLACAEQINNCLKFLH